MKMREIIAARLLLFLLPLFLSFSASAQDPLETPPDSAGRTTARKLPAAELERLASPIALYPDVLLGQMLPASAFPEQIVDAALLIKTKEDAKLIPDQNWDASVKAIANYPGVLKMMYEKMAWTRSLGEAFLNQHKDLLNAIQRLRTRAQEHGNLETNEQQKVVSDTTAQGQTIIRVEPADPQVIYVPQTTSNVVYSEPAPSTSDSLAPLVTFGLGMALGAAVADDDDDDHYHGGGYYWGPSGIWVSDDAYDDWYDQRRDTVEHMENQAKKRQDYRQDYRSDRQDFRQDMIKDNPEQAKQYYDQRQQQAQERRSSANQTAAQRRENVKSSSAYQSRQSQYSSSSRQQQVDAARKEMQGKQWSGGSSGASSQWASSRGYAGGSAKSSSSTGAFGGVNSGSRASTYASRGAQSRSSAGQYRSSYGGGSAYRGSSSRSSYSGGARMSGGGRGGGRGGGGRRR